MFVRNAVRAGVNGEKELFGRKFARVGAKLPRERKLAVRGFSGTVTNTSLHDIIQLLCIGRTNCRMLVRSGIRKGVIYFREGEITHAESTDNEGEEAFYDILSWELGSFLCDETTTETQTIHENWDFLLMESMRRLDRLWGP